MLDFLNNEEDYDNNINDNLDKDLRENFYLVISNVTKENNNTVIEGIVKNAKIYKNDMVYILQNNNNIISTLVKEIKDSTDTVLESGEINQNIRIVLDILNDSHISKYDVVTNKKTQLGNHGKATENIRLLALLNHWKKNDKDVDLINNIIKEIVENAKFISPIIRKIHPVNDKNTETSYLVITNPSHENFYPVFTDWDNLIFFNENEEQEILIQNFDEYINMFNSESTVKGFVINPGKHNFLITREMALDFGKQKKEYFVPEIVENKLENDDEILLSDPKNMPIDFINGLNDFFKTNKNINKVWIQLMKSEDKIDYLLILDSDEDLKKIFEDISLIARPYLGDMNLNLAPYDENNLLSQVATKDTKPFYTKE